MEILIAMIVIWGFSVCMKSKKKLEDREAEKESRLAGRSEERIPSTTVVRKEIQKEAGQVFAEVRKKRSTAVPNKPRRQKLGMEEKAIRDRTRASSEACTYEAAYSKGKPDRIGGRGDYETVTPKGMERIHCSYCGAQNFVPVGSRNHYHCYFCWEKL